MAHLEDNLGCVGWKLSAEQAARLNLAERTRDADLSACDHSELVEAAVMFVAVL